MKAKGQTFRIYCGIYIPNNDTILLPFGSSDPATMMPGMHTFPETTWKHLKMDGWKVIVSFWDGFLASARS